MFNILVVDDEYLSREGIKSIIQEELEEDVKVLEAANGIEARKIVDEQNLDVILLDINIPGINGIDLCRYIKLKYTDIYIIVTTAYDDLETKNKLMNLNVNKYLEKPIRPQKIVDSLKKILNKNNKISTSKKKIKDCDIQTICQMKLDHPLLSSREAGRLTGHSHSTILSVWREFGLA